jgi:hypothetical protein
LTGRLFFGAPFALRCTCAWRLFTKRTFRQLQNFTALDEHFTQKRTFAVFSYAKEFFAKPTSLETVDQRSEMTNVEDSAK